MTTSSPKELEQTAKQTSRQRVRDSHVGLYLVTRFTAVWFTAVLICTFFAEAVLNTVRSNKAIVINGTALFKDSALFNVIQRFYPDGTNEIQLITFDLVCIYIFVVAAFTMMRFTYHKALRDDSIEPFIGGLSWESLKNQSLLVKMCWKFSPTAGVHKKFFVFWLGYILIFTVIFSVAALFGVKVYLSSELKTVLFGGGIIVALGLLEDMQFFEKIPPREVIISSLLALVEGGRRLDISGTVKRISAIAEEAKGPGNEQVIELLETILKALKEKEAQQLLADQDVKK